MISAIAEFTGFDVFTLLRVSLYLSIMNYAQELDYLRKVNNQEASKSSTESPLTNGIDFPSRQSHESHSKNSYEVQQLKQQLKSR